MAPRAFVVGKMRATLLTLCTSAALAAGDRWQPGTEVMAMRSFTDSGGNPIAQGDGGIVEAVDAQGDLFIAWGAQAGWLEADAGYGFANIEAKAEMATQQQRPEEPHVLLESGRILIQEYIHYTRSGVIQHIMGRHSGVPFSLSTSHSHSGIPSGEAEFHMGADGRNQGPGDTVDSPIVAVNIPKEATSVGSKAVSAEFKPYLSDLKTVTFEAGSKLKIIRTMAFAGTHLTSIRIPAEVKQILGKAFWKSTLKEVIFEGSTLPQIAKHAFSSSSLTRAVFPQMSKTQVEKAKLEYGHVAVLKKAEFIGK